MALQIRRSSGNVFADLGSPPAQAARLLVRTDLMIDIRRILKERGLTTARAAKVLGVSQQRVTELRRGRVQHFRINTLVGLLARLGVALRLRTWRMKRVA